MMQTYEQYKDSGIDWIGQIPEHWELIPNKFIFRLKKNQVGKRSSEYDLLSLTLRGIIKRDMENPEGKFPAEFDTYQEVKVNDFVFCLFDVEETPRTVGLSIYDGMITGAYTVMEPIDENFAPYLYYYYLNADDKKQLKFLYRGLRNTIPKDSFFSLKTAIPPIQEQEAIANFLDEKTAKIDALVQTKEQQIEKLKEVRQAKIHQAVTKGLDSNAPTKDSGVECIGEIPAHWEVTDFKRILIGIKDGTHGTHQRVSNGNLLLSAKNIHNNGIRISGDESMIADKDFHEITKNGYPKKNDLLITCVGTIGRTYVYDLDYPIAFQRSVAFLRFNLLKGVPNYFKFYIESPYYQFILSQLTKTSAQGGVYMGDILKSTIILPTLPEQEQIVAYLDEVTRKIDQAIAQKQEQITKLKEYKQSLINDVVTGKVMVC